MILCHHVPVDLAPAMWICWLKRNLCFVVWFGNKVKVVIYYWYIFILTVLQVSSYTFWKFIEFCLRKWVTSFPSLVFIISNKSIFEFLSSLHLELKTVPNGYGYPNIILNCLICIECSITDFSVLSLGEVVLGFFNGFYIFTNVFSS